MTTDDERQYPVSTYLDYLPAVYQQDAVAGQPHFLGRFLLAFEHILTGRGDSAAPGLEEILQRVQRYFDPQHTPVEFLEWLSGWVALSLRADLDAPSQRDFIARAVWLYRLRGTRAGLEEIIKIYTGLSPTIDELHTGLRVGFNAHIGIDTLLDEGAPHFFKVTLRLPTPDLEKRRQMIEIVTAILDMEKPAHTYYNRATFAANVITPVMQIGVNSKIGEDTLLDPMPQ